MSDISPIWPTGCSASSWACVATACIGDLMMPGDTRDAVIAFIRRLYLAGVTDPKRLTFKGLQALSRV
jgi:hypothetical protein